MRDLVVKFQERKCSGVKPIHFSASIPGPRSQGTHLTPEGNIGGSGSAVTCNWTEPDNQYQLLEDLSHKENRFCVANDINCSSFSLVGGAILKTVLG